METNILAPKQLLWPIKIPQRNYLRYHCVPLICRPQDEQHNTQISFLCVTNAQLDAKHATVGSKIHQTTGQIFLFLALSPVDVGGSSVSYFFVFENPRTNAKKWPHIAVLSAVIWVEFYLGQPVSHPVASSCRNIFTTFRTFGPQKDGRGSFLLDEYNPWHVVKQQQIYTGVTFYFRPCSTLCIVNFFLCAPVGRFCSRSSLNVLIFLKNFIQLITSIAVSDLNSLESCLKFF